MSDLWEIYRLSETYDNMISKEFHDELLTLMKNPLKLPPHLKSVPEWQRYMNCCHDFTMLVILRAKHDGLFLGSFDNPVPAALIAVED